ncbi:UNVERIFIED_CONTAM: hypothetical protein NCL1_49101 [Trichonephila clavipes]
MPFSSEVQDWSKSSSWKGKRKNSPTNECWGLIFNHDNAFFHTAGLTVVFFKQKQVNVIEHLSYAMDLTIGGFWLFLI